MRKEKVENFRLSTLAKYYGIEFQSHRALNDGSLPVLMDGESCTAYAEGDAVPYYAYSKYEWTYKITNEKYYVK